MITLAITQTPFEMRTISMLIDAKTNLGKAMEDMYEN